MFEEFQNTLKKHYEEERERTKTEHEKLFEEKIKSKEEEVAAIKSRLEEAETEREEREKKIEEKYKNKIDELAEKIEKSEGKEEESETKIDELKDTLKEKEDKLRELKEDHNEHTERLKSEYEQKLRELEHKTSTELGDEGQAEVLDLLLREFTRDDIKETKHGKAGSDIFHKIIYNGEEIGLIVYEVKNVSNWNTDFIKQVKEEKTRHCANYAFLVTNVFPARERTICEKEGIIVVCPSKVAIIAREVRNFLLEAHKAKLSGEEIEEKIKLLQEYLTSPEYRNALVDLFNATKDWRDLRDKEKHSHERHWAEEEKLNGMIHQRAAKIHVKIASIIETKTQKIPLAISYEQHKKKKKRNEET
jgi:hypothetical protein